MKGSLKAFQLPGELLEIEEALFECEGDPPQELRERIERFCVEGPQALEQAFQVVESLEGDTAILDSAMKTMAERKARKDGAAKRMRAMLLEVIDTSFKGKVKLPELSLWGQNTDTDSVVFESLNEEHQQAAVEALPDDLKRVKVEPDKTAIKNRWNETGELPEGFIIESRTTRSLRSKRS